MDKTYNNPSILFEETQQFRQSWVWILVLPISVFGVVLFLFIMYSQFILGKPVGNHPIPNKTMLWFAPLMLIVFLSIPILLYYMKLIVQVDFHALHVHFFPLLKKNILISEIAEWKAREYKPLLEYGGWGVRWGPSGKAYNVSGTCGVQLKFSNGKRLLIGSQRAEELEAAISRAKSR